MKSNLINQATKYSYVISQGGNPEYFERGVENIEGLEDVFDTHILNVIENYSSSEIFSLILMDDDRSIHIQKLGPGQ